MSSLRDVMPQCAEWTDKFRQKFGAEFVTSQVRQSEAARVKYETILAEEGQEAADRWRRANWRELTFFASEGGRTVGLKDPFTAGVTPCVDPRLVQAAAEKLQQERERARRRKANGAD